MENNAGAEADELSFCPEDLTVLADKAKEVRIKALLMDEAGSESEAEQFCLLAMASLEQAERFFRLASLKQTRAIALRL